MLTPDKIKEKTFQTTGRGSYRAEDVDGFLNEVSSSYEQMFKENGDLIRKISILAKKVEEYRADEESLKLALLNAQKLADKIVAEAKETAEKENADVRAETEKLRADTKAETDKLMNDAKTEAEELNAKAKRESDAIIESAKAEAEKIVAEANRQFDEILGNINRKVTHETLVYEMIQKEASEFKGRLVSMYKEHINLINKMPEIVDEQLDGEKAEASDTAEKAEETMKEPGAEEAVEEPIAEALAEETAEEVAEPVSEPEIEEAVVEEAPVQVEEIAEAAEEAEETSSEAPAPKPFKLDLSKIDFADDIDDDIVIAEEPYEPVETVEPVTVDDEDEGVKSISFKNFFKKK